MTTTCRRTFLDAWKTDPYAGPRTVSQNGYVGAGGDCVPCSVMAALWIATCGKFDTIPASTGATRSFPNGRPRLHWKLNAPDAQRGLAVLDVRDRGKMPDGGTCHADACAAGADEAARAFRMYSTDIKSLYGLTVPSVSYIDSRYNYLPSALENVSGVLQTKNAAWSHVLAKLQAGESALMVVMYRPLYWELVDPRGTKGKPATYSRLNGTTMSLPDYSEPVRLAGYSHTPNNFGHAIVVCDWKDDASAGGLGSVVIVEPLANGRGGSGSGIQNGAQRIPLVYIKLASDGLPTGTNSVQAFTFQAVSGSQNQGPDITLSATPKAGSPTLAVAFTASATDPEGNTPIQWAWDFGDGDDLFHDTGTGGSSSPSHNYTATGVFTAYVKATDSLGNFSTKSITINTSGTLNDPSPPQPCEGAAE